MRLHIREHIHIHIHMHIHILYICIYILYIATYICIYMRNDMKRGGCIQKNTNKNESPTWAGATFGACQLWSLRPGGQLNALLG